MNSMALRPRRRIARAILMVSAALALIAAAYVGLVVVPKMRPLAQAATGYMARVGCACHFIGGRSLASCLTDKEANMEQVRLSADPATRRMTASIPLIAQASARHTPSAGCVLER